MSQEWTKLPINAKRTEIVELGRLHGVTIIQSDTGTGKSTQVPKFYLEDDPQRHIAVLEPRRIAATMTARRVAEEMGESIGGRVGYHVRFDKKMSANTRITYMTDGMFLQLIRNNEALLGTPKFTHVIVDEAHERSTNIDVSLGFLLHALMRRSHDPENPLHVVIMSATIDTARFARFFADFEPKVISIMGTRRYEIAYKYAKPFRGSFVDEACRQARDVVSSDTSGGSVIVFLTGEGEIKRAHDLLSVWLKGTDVIVNCLYGSMDASERRVAEAPAPAGKRKIILATNIAETSVTLPDVTCVIDCGYAKQLHYHPTLLRTGLALTPISRAAADQRAGRAGRTAPGTCIRLYSEDTYRGGMDATTPPDICRSDLSAVFFALITAGCNPLRFYYIDRPPRSAALSALRSLQLYGLITSNLPIANINDTQLIGERVDTHEAVSRANDARPVMSHDLHPTGVTGVQLTATGRLAQLLPSVEPRYVACFAAAIQANCVVEVAALLALLEQSRAPLRWSPANPRRGAVHTPYIVDWDSDHITLINAFAHYIHLRVEANQSSARHAAEDAGLNGVQFEDACRLWVNYVVKIASVASDVFAVPGQTQVSLARARELLRGAQGVFDSDTQTLSPRVLELMPRFVPPEVRLSVLSCICAGNFGQAALYTSRDNCRTTFRVLRTEIPVLLDSGSVIMADSSLKKVHYDEACDAGDHGPHVAGGIERTKLVIFDEIVPGLVHRIRTVTLVDVEVLINAAPEYFPFGHYASLPSAVPYPDTPTAHELQDMVEKIHGTSAFLSCPFEGEVEVTASKKMDSVFTEAGPTEQDWGSVPEMEVGLDDEDCISMLRRYQY